MADEAATVPVSPRRRVLLPLLAVALFALIVAMFWVGLGLDPRKLPSALLDKPVPEFDLPPLKEGGPGLASADLKGQVTLVNIFASWCVPCRIEHPLLLRLAKEKKVAVVGIAWKDKRADAQAFLAELGNPYARIGFDGSGRAGIDWGVYGVPETYVVDRDGRIRYKVVGPMMPEELNERVLPLIEKLKK
jgi:cytochrome c biogenesis protein CcmG/thiol:disulfide interchange protein DsbE